MDRNSPPLQAKEYTVAASPRPGAYNIRRLFDLNWGPKKHISIRHKHLKGISLYTLLGFIITGFIWDIPILIFAYVLFGAL